MAVRPKNPIDGRGRFDRGAIGFSPFLLLLAQVRGKTTGTIVGRTFRCHSS
jgi:hypothetical protein